MATNTRKVAWDKAWHEWNDEPAGKRKDRLLSKLLTSQEPLMKLFCDRVLRSTLVYVDAEDVYQNGRIGLLRAIRKYDPDRGCQFSTMAYFWIRHEAQNATLHETQMYRPRGSDMSYKASRKVEAIAAEFGRDATAEELEIKPELLEVWKNLVFRYLPLDDHNPGFSEGADESRLRTPVAMYDQSPLADEALQAVEELTRVSRAVKSLTPLEYKLLIDNDDKGIPKGVADNVREAAIIRLRKTLGQD